MAWATVAKKRGDLKRAFEDWVGKFMNFLQFNLLTYITTYMWGVCVVFVYMYISLSLSHYSSSTKIYGIQDNYFYCIKAKSRNFFHKIHIMHSC